MRHWYPLQAHVNTNLPIHSGQIFQIVTNHDNYTNVDHTTIIVWLCTTTTTTTTHHFDCGDTSIARIVCASKSYVSRFMVQFSASVTASTINIIGSCLWIATIYDQSFDW